MLAVKDANLVLDLQTDSINAYNAIYWKYHKALYGNILKLTKDIDATEDILQEVFITLWEKRLNIDTQLQVSDWLFTISYNKSIDHLKKIQKEKLVFSHQPFTAEVCDNTTICFSESRLLVLEKAMDLLSPQKRKVFELCKMQGKSYHQAAEELNISKHTIKEYLSLGIASIKEYIALHPLLLFIYLSFAWSYLFL